MSIVYIKVQECEHTGDLEPVFDMLRKVHGRTVDYGVNLEEEVGWVKVETEESVDAIASLIIADENLYGFAHCTTYRPDYAR